MSSFAIAVIALMISFLGLVWNVFNTFFRLPRLHVALSKQVHLHVELPAGTVTDLDYKFSVSVINTGGEATTIIDAGLMLGDKALVASVTRGRAANMRISGPDLPSRLEAHGALTWEIPPELFREVGDGVPLFGFASRFAPSRSRKRRGTPQVFRLSPLSEVMGVRK